jgi:hypothetical protein
LRGDEARRSPLRARRGLRGSWEESVGGPPHQSLNNCTAVIILAIGMQEQVMESRVMSDLDGIKTRLDTLTMLYKNLIDALVKTGKILPDEKRALKSKEKLMSEKALFDALKA